MSCPFKFYLVGGCVRDKLLGRTSNDIDYLAVPKSENSLNVFQQLCDYLLSNHTIIQKNTDFLTIKTKNSNNQIVDYVLPRRDVRYEHNSRHPVTELSSMYEDLMRRDFTINSLALDLETQEIVDVCSGIV